MPYPWRGPQRSVWRTMKSRVPCRSSIRVGMSVSRLACRRSTSVGVECLHLRDMSRTRCSLFVVLYSLFVATHEKRTTTNFLGLPCAFISYEHAHRLDAPCVPTHFPGRDSPPHRGTSRRHSSASA